MAFVLHSPAFADGAPIPRKYARDGDNVSPPLEWSGAPGEARSYVVLVEDPDAPKGVFRHWATYDIPADTRELPEGAGSASHALGLKHGVNDFGAARYDGPQPPPGHGRHHYHFRLAALSVATLAVPQAAKAEAVWAAARPAMIAETEIVGTFERS